MPGVWDTDRIRESIAAYLVSRGQNVDSFRFFPTIYDDGLRHANYAGTYPRQKSVTGAGAIPARTECDCHYGAEFSSVSESLADETTTQVALTHELGHECVFYADYKDVDGVVKGPWRDAGVPCFGGAHPNNGLANPSMFPDTESGLSTISVMGGSVAGTYQLTAPRFGYSRAEMYFLGLASPAEVTPITFVQNGVTSQITIDEIVAANGVRTPAYANGQTRVFRVPTFVVKRSGETVSDAQLQQLQNVLFRWQSRFYRETGGRARANLTLDGGCSYTLSASSIRPASTAATGSISVLADNGCPWTADHQRLLHHRHLRRKRHRERNGELLDRRERERQPPHRHDHHRRPAVHRDAVGSSEAARGGAVDGFFSPVSVSHPPEDAMRHRLILALFVFGFLSTQSLRRTEPDSPSTFWSMTRRARSTFTAAPSTSKQSAERATACD